MRIMCDHVNIFRFTLLSLKYKNKKIQEHYGVMKSSSLYLAVKGSTPILSTVYIWV